MTLIQRLGSALNLSVHFDTLFLDRVHLESASVPCLRRVKTPTPAKLERRVYRRSRRIDGRGLRVCDLEGGTLALDQGDQETLDEVRGHSSSCVSVDIGTLLGAARLSFEAGRQAHGEVASETSMQRSMETRGSAA